MPVRVLVIDDSADSVKTDFDATINDPDVEFIYESDPVKSIKDLTFLSGSLANDDIDIILLDINFHRRNNREEISEFFDVENTEAAISTLGITILQRIREIDPDIPIGMITAYEHLETAFEAGAGKAQFYWPKPKKEFSADDGEKILHLIKQTINETHYRYDKDQQKISNQLAATYIDLETSKPGTVSYWIYEDELLTELVNNMTSEGQLDILDIGCGEGRYERLILKDHEKDLTITGLDFSGRMLDECRRQLTKEFDNDSLKLARGIAEKLKWNDNTFDIVILGFGFPCYSRIDSILLEATRVLKPEGVIFISIYNYDALFYDAWPEDLAKDSDIPISGKIERDKGVLNLDGNEIGIRPYTMDEFRRLLSRHKLKIGFESTFPTLYSTLPVNKLLNTTKDENDLINPDKAYKVKGLSKILYEQDKITSRNLGKLGYYGVFIASSSTPKTKFITELPLGR